MKTIHSALVAALLLAGVVPQAFAATETPAGTAVVNTAQVHYSVGGTPQTVAESDDVTFVVDRKVDLIVTNLSAAPVNIASGTSSTIANGNVLMFQVTNNSNDTIDVLLSADNVAGGTLPGGGTDEDDTTIANLKYYVSTDTTWDAGDVNQDWVDGLEPGASSYVFVAADPIDQHSDGTLVGILLTGTAANAYTGAVVPVGDAGHAAALDTGKGTALAETADTNAGVENVFVEAADTDGAATPDPKENGQDQALAAFNVQSAQITVSKQAVTYWDEFNGKSNPKAIPGAMVLYCITVSNGENGQAATDVIVSDNIPAGTTFVQANDFTDTGIPDITTDDAIRFNETGACSAAAWEAADAAHKEDIGTTTDADSDDDGHLGDFSGGVLTTKVLSLPVDSSTTTMFMVTVDTTP